MNFLRFATVEGGRRGGNPCSRLLHKWKRRPGIGWSRAAKGVILRRMPLPRGRVRAVSTSTSYWSGKPEPRLSEQGTAHERWKRDAMATGARQVDSLGCRIL